MLGRGDIFVEKPKTKILLHHFYLILHIFAATIWVGGHFLLLVRYLPKALREQNTNVISDYEKQYEVVGIPALLISIITGILLAYHYGVPIGTWFSFSSPIEKVVSIKLLLLLTTVILAIHARFFIIPRLSTRTLPMLGWHILAVTALGISLLTLGTFVRMGGL